VTGPQPTRHPAETRRTGAFGALVGFQGFAGLFQQVVLTYHGLSDCEFQATPARGATTLIDAIARLVIARWMPI
jgi:hypothetical protein